MGEGSRARPKRIIPYRPSDTDTGSYKVCSIAEKIVADYMNISLTQTEELTYDDFLFYLREGYIYKLQKTEQGRQYLEDCKRLAATKPDKKRLRERFGERRATHGIR